MRRSHKFAVHVGAMAYRLPDASSVLWLGQTLKEIRRWGGIRRGPAIKLVQTDWLDEKQLDEYATKLSGFA